MSENHPNAQNDPETLERVVERYCRDKPLRPASEKNYKGLARRLTREAGMVLLDDLTYPRLLEWRDEVVARSSMSTFNNYHRHLKAVCNYAVDHGLLESNPFHKIKQFSRANRRRKGCTEEEVEQFLQFLMNDTINPLSGKFIVNMVLVFYFTGIRLSQLCGLVWRDIDFQENTILLRKQHSKTGRGWPIPLHEDLRGPLLEMKKEIQNRFGTRFKEEDQIFWVQRYSDKFSGINMVPAQVSGLFNRLSRRSGIALSPHRIRHMVATTLANQHAHETKDNDIPASLVAIKDLLGHENINTTVGYIEPQISTQRELIQGLKVPGIMKKGNGNGKWSERKGC